MENGIKKSTKSKLKSDDLEFLVKFREQQKLRCGEKIVQMSLAEFGNEIVKHSESVHSPKTTSNYRTTFKYLLYHFGNVLLSTFTKPFIEDYIEERA